MKYLTVHGRQAMSLGRKQAIYELDQGATEPREDPLWVLDETGPTSITLFEDITGERFDPFDDGHSAVGIKIGDAWRDAYFNQFTRFVNCEHEFRARGLSVTDKARCRNCGVTIMAGYILPSTNDND